MRLVITEALGMRCGGWLPATTSPAVVEVVEAGHEPGPQPALHQVFNLTSATSSSSKTLGPDANDGGGLGIGGFE